MGQVLDYFFGKGVAPQEIVRGIGEVGEVIFPDGLKYSRIAAGGIIYPIVAHIPLQPFMGMCPFSPLALGPNYFAIEVKMEDKVVRDDFGEDAAVYWEALLSVNAASNFM